MEDRTVLLTGFGPFGEHKVNASWKAVELLDGVEVDGCKIRSVEVPVTYQYVDDKVPELWKKYDPVLTVHVGVSSFTKKLTLETRAEKGGYVRSDCTNCRHPTGTSQGERECISTGIDVAGICDALNREEPKYCSSENAGRYLCEYIYYKSLNIDAERTLFVHVPVLNDPYTAEELADGILKVVAAVLKQIRKGSNET